MPTRHSKLAITATCRDYAHPWTESCINATAGLGLHALQESLRIYSTVYVITLLMSGKVPRSNDIKRTILGILQSTAFLSFSGFAYSVFICVLRRLFGHFNIATVSFLPSFLSSLFAILIERPSRRPLLCLYVSNIATETLFRMGVWRGYFAPIPHGQVYIFAISIAVLLHFYRSKKTYRDSIYKIIRFLIGPHEEFDHIASGNSCSTKFPNKPSGLRRDGRISDSEQHIRKSSFNAVQKAFDVYKNIIETIKAQTRHISCPHPHSCAYYVLSGAGRLFTYGLCGQLALKVIFQMKRLIRNPRQLRSTIFRRDNLKLAMFIGGFAGIYRFVSCALRKTFDRDSRNFAIPAGLLASVAFIAFPDNTIALYFMWKALQLLWNKGVEDGRLPEVKWFVIFLYCFSTAVLFHVAIMEPQNLRASYWKFLCQVSGGRIATMCRTPLDQFGLDTTTNTSLVLKKTHTTDQNIYSF